MKNVHRQGLRALLRRPRRQEGGPGPLRGPPLSRRGAPGCRAPAAAALGRRGLVGVATVGLTTLPAAARASDKTGWKQDIPRALTSLQRLDWAAIRTVGKERSGAESVRSLLLTRYDEVLEGTSPAGGKIGLNVNGCRITAVSDPNLGFLEED
ncbi:unnamed protein product, partial [Prorocentrum cordatum]